MANFSGSRFELKKIKKMVPRHQINVYPLAAIALALIFITPYLLALNKKKECSFMNAMR